MCVSLFLSCSPQSDSQYLKRKPRRLRPTAHLPYDQGLHLVRAFLVYASHHTVEEVQAFMAQGVPAPTWIRLEAVTIPADALARAAALIEAQLGADGVRRVGGRRWWQWRKPHVPLQAEWIEMKRDYGERRRQALAKAATDSTPTPPTPASAPASTPASDSAGPGRRVMFYIHGGAFFMGSVDEHRYQLQRHARKLKARVFAPRYRLAPQFPFPCGLLDCLAAYLHLLRLQHDDAATIVLAGDSAGGGMVLALLVVLRDHGLPLPAGAVLISPWVDLAHSFPSLGEDCPFDYIPPYGFHQRPSMAWPPPTEGVLKEMGVYGGSADSGDASSAMLTSNRLTTVIDDAGDEVRVDEQIQLYTTNNMFAHPLVSPVLQPTLGGLPPLLIITGGGEILRDEQMFIAHKCADPARYAPPDAQLDAADRAALARFPPTDVQLQVWDDLCHVAPTLSFTRPAKFMYRSIAQFGTWALARAQQTAIDIPDDDALSTISTSSSDREEGGEDRARQTEGADTTTTAQIGRAGDPLPPFVHHMIRQRVTRHGDVFPLAPARDLPGPRMGLDHPERVGVPQHGPVGKWLQAKRLWDARYARDAARVRKRRLHDASAAGGGFYSFGPDEHPPPSALAGRLKAGEAGDLDDFIATGASKPSKNYGLALWSLWSSRHDESTVEREQEAEVSKVKTVTAAEGGGERQTESSNGTAANSSETAVTSAAPATPTAPPLAPPSAPQSPSSAPSPPPPVTGVTGKRPFLGGIALPFSLNKEAETASMLTLQSDERA